MSTSNPQMLLENQAVDVAVADNPLFGTVDNDKFSLSVWSPSGVWGGGTVNIYQIAPRGGDETPILLEAFTENTARVGFNGQIGWKIKAEVVGATGADISASLSC
jgi:hypothetical protein